MYSKMSMGLSFAPLLSAVHMAMNADLLALGSNVFSLRGTTGECVPATIVGLSSFPDFVAISYEHSGHTELYRDCPVEHLTFPIVRTKSPASKHCVSPPPVHTSFLFWAVRAVAFYLS